MTPRPRVAAPLLVSVLAALPARLRRRLDEAPDLAAAWPWEEEHGGTLAVRAAETAVVTLPATGVVASGDQVACSCLLAPRCLHRAAVLRALAVAEEEAGAERRPSPSTPARSTAGEPEIVTPRPAQRRAAEEAWLAGVALLHAGASAAGPILEGDLLRAAHSGRVASLPRLASACERAASRVRQLRSEAVEFSLDALAADVFEVLATARALLAPGPVGARWVGRARRTYLPVGPLRLTGLFAEPVVSAAGYAGVVTYLVDRRGQLWTIGNVTPGGPERCLAAYSEPARLAEVALPPVSLARTGLHVRGATGSDDGRLGAGRETAAVVTGGSDWFREPAAGLWAEPVAAQLDRAWSAAGPPASGGQAPRAGVNLLFLRCSVVGARRDALVVAGEQGVGELAAVPPAGHGELRYRANLRLLGSAPGLSLLAIGRALPTRPRSLALLAVAPAEAPAEAEAAGGRDGPRLRLPRAWTGRVNLGLDALHRSYLAGALPQPAALDPDGDGEPDPDPLDALARRVRRAVAGGGATLSEVAWSGVLADEAALRRHQMPAGAGVLGALRQAAATRAEGSPRERFERFARAWLAARAYQQAASARLQRLSWG